MERTTERLTVRRELAIAASPETVWEFLVDSEKARRWWGSSVEIEARPGTVLRVESLPGHVIRGEVVEVEPPRRIVYTFGWEAGGDLPALVPPGSSTVEIVLEPSGGGTTLVLTHSELPGEEAAESHGRGWEHYLERLALAAAGTDPGPDPWAGRGM